MIYLDNAATTKIKPKEVIDSVIEAMKTMGNASRGVYDESLSADMVVYNARLAISELFNGPGPKQVAFTKNSTEALNIAIRGMINEGDHVITTEMEHNSVIRPLNHLKDEKNICIDYLKMDSLGNLNPNDLLMLINDKTTALVLNHASNVTGNLNDLCRFGEICKENKIKFIVDASQTAGLSSIDMKKMGIDVVCFTGHKSLFGPQGTGGLCVSKDTEIRPLITGGTGVQTYNDHQPHEMPTRLEAGTLNSHGIAGLLAGVNYINKEGMDKIREEALNLAKAFYDGVKDIPGLTFYGDYRDFSNKSPIVSLNIKDLDSSYVSGILSEKYGIATRPGAHCAPLVHKAFATVDRGMVRFSFSHFNTYREIQSTIEAIKELAL